MNNKTLIAAHHYDSQRHREPRHSAKEARSSDQCECTGIHPGPIGSFERVDAKQGYHHHADHSSVQTANESEKSKLPVN